MAGTGNINESNVSNLTEQQLSKMDASELEKVLEVLDDIKDRMGGWNDDQKRVAASAAKYRRELEKAGRTIDENTTKIGKFNNEVRKGADDLSGRLQGLSRVVEGGFFDPMKKLAGAWGNADQAANDFGKRIGLNTKAVAQLRDESIKFANDVHIGAKYNASIKDMIELQQKYASSVGRNLQLTNKQRETLLATSKVMGENTVDFTRKLENLGIGLERSGSLAAKMYNEAAKSGISFEKTSKYVTENLTKVQNYGFKNGVEGLTAMAKRAAEVNLNIAEAFKVADKIQTGGVQEAIKMGAGLQVLGGNFASFGDPMGMLYQGLNDIEGLQDRMIKMFTGYGGIKNGEFKISGANRLLVNQAAQTMGVDANEMYNMISRQAVRDRVEKQMGSRFNGDEELKQLLLNTATLNKDNQAVVNIRGKEKKLSEVTDADKKYLQDMQKSESDDIKDIAQILRGYTDVQEGFTKEIENKKASAFSEIGKFTKGLYGRMGESNVILTIIKDAVLAQALLGAVSNVSGGLQNAFGRGRGGIGGMRGGAAPRGGIGGGMTGGGIMPGGYQMMGNKRMITPTGQIYNMKTGELMSQEQSAAFLSRQSQIKAASAAKTTSTVGKVAKFANSGVGRAIGGGALGGAMAGIGYLADGSFTSGNRADINKAAGGTIGAAIGGAALSFLGPMGSMLGAEAGKFLGELGGKWLTQHQTKKRDEKKEELTTKLGKTTEKGKAVANLKGDYSRKELDKIAKALSDGKITDGELKDGLLKKMAKNGDTDVIEKFGTKSAKAKMNKQIEAINAKIESGRFNMDTGEFSIGNANFGMIEPVAMARGGKLEGPSDINGPGMPIQGTNIVVGGGEYVVNAEATKRNEDLLDRINSGASFKMAVGGIMPAPVIKFDKGGKLAENIGNPGGDKKIQMPIKISNILPNLLKSPLAPLPVRAAMSAADRLRQKSGGIDKMEVAPIKLDVSGTIKLDSNGKQVDLDAIINNPAFISQLSQMIERRLSDNINGGNFKEMRKNKQHTF